MLAQLILLLMLARKSLVKGLRYLFEDLLFKARREPNLLGWHFGRDVDKLSSKAEQDLVLSFVLYLSLKNL